MPLLPSPAFAELARHFLALRTAKELAERESALSPRELSLLDGARAVAGSLKLTLALERDGTPIVTHEMEVLHGEPPQLRILW